MGNPVRHAGGSVDLHRRLSEAEQELGPFFAEERSLMRQVGSLSKQRDAQRFAAYLITQGIEAHAEEDGGDWAVWVRDENEMESARQAFEEFKADPADARYHGAERAADAILREKENRRQRARENVHDMREKWRRGSVQKATLTFVLIGLCVMVAIFSSFGDRSSSITRQLMFCNPAHLQDGRWDGDDLVDVKAGEVWRLITPAFLHFDILHLVFNAYMLYYLGGQVEDRRGMVRYALLVLAIAVTSNFAQALGRHAWFGGMSGVNYGLFGYVWMKTLYEPEAGMFVSQGTIWILVIWFFLCLAGVIGNVANIAHGAGLALGVALGYAPVLWRSRPGR